MAGKGDTGIIDIGFIDWRGHHGRTLARLAEHACEIQLREHIACVFRCQHTRLTGHTEREVDKRQFATLVGQC